MHPTDFPDGYIPHYELGVGSMGQVWLARTAEAGSHCAVKVLNLRKDKRGSAERSFNREVRAMARLDHPGIIRSMTSDVRRRVSFRCDGVRIRLAVESVYASLVELAPIMDIARRPLNALGHAHARDLVHRDLKPGNIIVLPDRVGSGAIIADGIARIAAPTNRSDVSKVRPPISLLRQLLATWQPSVRGPTCIHSALCSSKY